MTASGLAGRLAELTGAERDRAGRVTVEADLTLPGHPEVFVLGDMVRVRGPTASRRAARASRPSPCSRGATPPGVVRARLSGREPPPSATATRATWPRSAAAAAVADIKGIRLSGFLAWATWLLVHLWYLIGFQNRLLVLIRWSFSFATRGRGARLITGTAALGERRDC